MDQADLTEEELHGAWTLSQSRFKASDGSFPPQTARFRGRREPELPVGSFFKIGAAGPDRLAGPDRQGLGLLRGTL